MADEDARVPDAPREDLIRMVTIERAEIRADAGADGRPGTMYGYAAVFNQDTTIDSWEGRFIERIAPGAFRKTLKERGDQVKVLFNHGMDPSIGDKPLGRASVMKEDSHGLAVEVPLSDTSYNRDLAVLLEDRAIDGMSFRMSVLRDDWVVDPDGNELPVRTIKEVRLYEFGPVTFPAYAATEAGVRAHARKGFAAWAQANGEPTTIIPTRSTGSGEQDGLSVDEPATDATRDDTPDVPAAEATVDPDDNVADAPVDDDTPDAPLDEHPPAPARSKRPPLTHDRLRAASARVRGYALALNEEN